MITRYSEPHRHYHTTKHLLHVLTMIDQLADDHDLFLVRLAAWYHDAVYAIPPGQVSNEEASARLALRELSRVGLEQEDLNQIARLVRLTETHLPGPRDPEGELLCDADLAILASDPADYADYRGRRTRGVRAGAGGGLPGRTASRADRACRPRDLPYGQGTSADRVPPGPTSRRRSTALQRAPRYRCGRIGCVISEPTQTPAVPVDRPTDWWKSAVVYQIYPRSFADSNGDGTGDIPGITSRLDYLAELGVDVVWLSPVYTSPMDDNGYDISDYQDVDPIFGTLEDLDRLIAGLHERGIKIVMDLVVNHTSDEHPWFIESRDPASAKRDWYWWRPARAGFEPGSEGAEPTNWESAFSGSAWQFDERSGEYYLHLFSPKQPDLNWENPEVRHAIYDMMNWWVDRGVDGFRMDVINLISKHELVDGEPPPGRTRAHSFLFTANGPRLDEFLAEMNAAVGLDARNLLTVGEMPGSTIETARRATDPANHELNMVFTFEHVSLDSRPGGGGKFDLAPLSLAGAEEESERVAAGSRRCRLELAVLGQP